jgi:hypothetical protein
MQGFFINIDTKLKGRISKNYGMTLGLKKEESFEAGGQSAGMKADGCLEGVWIDPAAFSFN